jgi:YggT family protein
MTLLQIIQFLVSVITGFLSGACLLRFYMQCLRLPLIASVENPYGPFLMALTNWLILPLRRLLPKQPRCDWASLLAAFLFQIVAVTILLLTRPGAVTIPFMILLALCGVLRVIVSWCSVLVFLYILLSWVAPRAPGAYTLTRLVEPMLRPIRRIIPPIGGIDISAMVFLIMLQIASTLLS